MSTPAKKLGKELQDDYDQLSQEYQDAFDEVGKMGFRLLKKPAGWEAFNTRTKQQAGPCESTIALLFEVRALEPVDIPEEEEKPEELKIAADSKGRTFLPGHEPVVIKELGQLVLNSYATTTEILTLQAQQKQERAGIIAMMHKYIDQLETNENGDRVYRVSDIEAVLEVEKKEKLHTRRVPDDD